MTSSTYTITTLLVYWFTVSNTTQVLEATLKTSTDLSITSKEILYVGTNVSDRVAIDYKQQSFFENGIITPNIYQKRFKGHRVRELKQIHVRAPTNTTAELVKAGDCVDHIQVQLIPFYKKIYYSLRNYKSFDEKCCSLLLEKILLLSKIFTDLEYSLYILAKPTSNAYCVRYILASQLSAISNALDEIETINIVEHYFDKDLTSFNENVKPVFANLVFIIRTFENVQHQPILVAEEESSNISNY